VTTTDGSCYRARTVRSDPQNVRIEDASLGAVSIPVGTVAQLRAE
jgi:hypothetical protein